MTAVAEACFGFLPYYLAWEIINISLEFTATAWVREPRWFCAVLGVNIVTHPLFVVLLETYGRTPLFILLCEACIVCVESLLLMVALGPGCIRGRWAFPTNPKLKLY